MHINAIVMQVLLIGLVVIAALVPFISFDPEHRRRKVGSDVLYHDRFVEIYPDCLVIHHFFPGPLGSRMIPFCSIRAVKLTDLEFWDGRARIQGTGDFKTWFARDIHRFMKNMAFIVYLDHGWYQVGFSVENFRKVISIFQSRGLLVQEVYRKSNRKR